MPTTIQQNTLAQPWQLTLLQAAGVSVLNRNRTCFSCPTEFNHLIDDNSMPRVGMEFFIVQAPGVGKCPETGSGSRFARSGGLIPHHKPSVTRQRTAVL
jgi:hypothetical protein